MSAEQKPDVTNVFKSVVCPKPYIPDEKIDELAPLFESPAYCRAFIEEMEDRSRRAQHSPGGLTPFELWECFEYSPNPRAKSIIKNILLHGREQGGVLNHCDGNRTTTTHLIGHLDPKDRKDVLCKPWMISDLVDASSYHWNDKEVVDWIDQYGPEDRLDILCADAVIDSLLNRGEMRTKLNRPKIMAWFDAQPEEGQARMMRAPYAALGFVKAFGREGLDIVKKYLPQEERRGILGDKGMLLHYFNMDVAQAYLHSLPEKARREFFDPKQLYSDVFANRHMYGGELRDAYLASNTPSP